MSSRASPPMPPPPPMGENTQMVDIEQPHKHDVLCGRGVTTNRFPGNESFRSLVSLNKELYVTSTKRQKMSISRSIVEAVRSLKPPGRFLEKNPVTGLWSDIGDRKAIEKTSQALRDGAAGLRKELSEDLGDPDFLSGLFDMDAAAAKSGSKKPASPTIKDKDKPVKAKPIKKGHRRTKSNPSVVSKAAAKTLKKHKSQHEADSSPEKPSRPSSLPPRAPLSPQSPPRSHPGSPPRGGWSMHFPTGSRSHRGPYPPPPHPEGAPHHRPYHRSHSYHPQMTPHHAPPRHPPPPHSWSHAPPRYRGPTSPPNVVHTPQSPLPPGRHQLTPNGCISKPPLSPVVARWTPRHFPRYTPYPPPPDYHGRPDYPPPPGRPEYSRSHPGHPPEYWPPHPDHHHRHHPPPHHRGHRDYYYDPHHPEGLDVPTLGGERGYYRHSRPRAGSREHEEPPQEFSPPVTPSRRRKPDKTSSSCSPSSVTSSSAPKPDSAGSRKTKTTPDRMSDHSEGTRSSSAMACEKSRSKDDATQKTVMSPLSEAEAGSNTGAVDVEMMDSKAEDQQEPPPLKKDVHIISVVHQMNDGTGEVEEGIEFMLKDPTADDYSLSPLPFEREDPTTLMELPDDILHLPISSCGPHDD